MTKKFIRNICIWGAIILMLALSAPKDVFAIKEPTYEYTDETAEATAFVVEVFTKLYLMDAPGYENTKITYNGSIVVVEAGDRVAGMNSVTTSHNELWYEVRWVEDGQEFHGYIYSGFKNGKWAKKYAVITEEAAINIPTPTPTPTDTPTPTPTSTPTPTPSPVPVQTKGDFPTIPFVLIIGVMVVLAAAAYYYFIVKKRQSNNQSGEQIKKLKNAIDRDSVIERERQLYENVAGGTRAGNRENLGQGVYTVRSPEEEALTNPDDYEGDERLKQIAENVKEKEIIRRELEALDARDMVYHKYFGEGQVMDNSDVNNVEVKFVNHGVMYIDKEEAARKSLMRKL